MKIICSAEAGSGQVGMYAIQLIEENVYKATLKKYTGNRHAFPGMLLLRKNIDCWLCFPEGYTGIVDCLVSELDKLFPTEGVN